MPSNPFDALDTFVAETIAAPEPTPAPEPKAVEQPIPASGNDEPPAQADASTDPVDRMNKSFEEFFKQQAEEKPADAPTDLEPEPEKVEEEPIKTDEPEAVKTDEPVDELETPELTAAKKKMSIKAAEAFDKVKASAKAKIEDLRAKLQEAEAKVSTITDSAAKELQAKVDAAEASLREKENKLAYYDVKEHPEYTKAVEEPTLAISNELSKIAKRNEVEYDTLTAAMLEKDPAKQNATLSELASGMTERDKAKLWQLVDDWEVVTAQETRIRENAIQAYTEIQERKKAEDAKSKEVATAEWKQATESVWGKLSEKVPSIKEVGQDALKQEFSALNLDSMPVNDRAYALATAVSFVPVVKSLQSKLQTSNSRIKELEATLSKYRKQSPGAGGGSTTQIPPASDKPGGFLEGIEARFAMMK